MNEKSQTQEDMDEANRFDKIGEFDKNGGFGRIFSHFQKLPKE